LATLKGNLQHEVASLRLEELYFFKDNQKKIEQLTDTENYYTSRTDSTLKVKWDKSCDETVNTYISYVKQIHTQYKPKHIFIEQKIKMRFYDNNINGIVDCAMVLENGDVIVVDLKTGRSKVDTEENNQMLMYAYGFIQDLHRKTKILPNQVIISICQSIVYNTRAVSYSFNDLISWYISQATPMKEINTNELVYRPNKKACQFCQFRADCNARIKEGIV
jgi:CRISPR/Cas system-associated exonuclease Cas4 (RecB family)